MKVQLNALLKNEKNEAIAREGASLSLRDVIEQCLLAPHEKLSGEDKMKRYRLWRKVEGKDEADLKSEDILLVKQVVGEAMPQLIYGQCVDMLEGSES